MFFHLFLSFILLLLSGCCKKDYTISNFKSRSNARQVARQTRHQKKLQEINTFMNDLENKYELEFSILKNEMLNEKRKKKKIKETIVYRHEEYRKSFKAGVKYFFLGPIADSPFVEYYSVINRDKKKVKAYLNYLKRFDEISYRDELAGIDRVLHHIGSIVISSKEYQMERKVNALAFMPSPIIVF